MFNSETIRWPAPAKLNLFLYITGQRTDGYHELQTLFQFIDRCDYLTVTPNLSGQITLSENLNDVALTDNLIYKAAMLLKEFAPTNCGAYIQIEKNLPMGGGLGGGSSDAATTLIALNYHWDLNFKSEKLAKIGLQLGADVPIFVFGKSAIAEGIGERLTAINPPENSYLVAVPPCHVSTPLVFKDPSLIRNTTTKSHQNLMAESWSNDCQPCVKNNYPEVAKAMDWLIEYAPTRLTGTGACIFSTLAAPEDAQVIINNAPSWLNVFAAKGLNNSPLNELLSTLS